MKKLIPWLLLAAVLLSACGTSSNFQPQQSQQPVPTQTPQTPAPTPEPVVIYDALYEAGTYSDDVGNTWNYLFRIPAIQAPGSDATRLNQELFSNLYPYVKDAQDAMKQHVSLIINRVDYTVHINGELISIVAKVSTDWGLDYYYAVNYDAGTKTSVDRAALLARFQLNEEQFLALASQVVDTYFQQHYGNIQRDAFWQDRHDKSAARENFTSDCQLYVDDNGTLCMIAKLYSFAGADYYYHSFPLT